MIVPMSGLASNVDACSKFAVAVSLLAALAASGGAGDAPARGTPLATPAPALYGDDGMDTVHDATTRALFATTRQRAIPTSAATLTTGLGLEFWSPSGAEAHERIRVQTRGGPMGNGL